MKRFALPLILSLMSLTAAAQSGQVTARAMFTENYSYNIEAQTEISYQSDSLRPEDKVELVYSRISEAVNMNGGHETLPEWQYAGVAPMERSGDGSVYKTTFRDLHQSKYWGVVMIRAYSFAIRITHADGQVEWEKGNDSAFGYYRTWVLRHDSPFQTWRMLSVESISRN